MAIEAENKPSTKTQVQQVIDDVCATAEQQGRLKLSKQILAECRAIKESLVDVDSLPNSVDTLVVIGTQKGTLDVISKILDIIEIK